MSLRLKLRLIITALAIITTLIIIIGDYPLLPDKVLIVSVFVTMDLASMILCGLIVWINTKGAARCITVLSATPIIYITCMLIEFRDILSSMGSLYGSYSSLTQSGGYMNDVYFHIFTVVFFPLLIFFISLRLPQAVEYDE